MPDYTQDFSNLSGDSAILGRQSLEPLGGGSGEPPYHGLAKPREEAQDTKIERVNDKVELTKPGTANRPK